MNCTKNGEPTITDTIDFKVSEFSPAISGFHNLPKDIYLPEIQITMNRIITGNLDNYLFAYIPVNLVSPINSKLIAKNVKAIIDTGAAYCLIKSDLIDYLQLISDSSDSNILHPIEGLQNVEKYFLDMQIDVENIDGVALIKNLRVGKLNADDYPADMIIGIELLRFCQFTYNAIEKTFELQFTNRQPS